ncbi:hypothetical protein JCM33374_g1491 [Metschnikowia sp. JCM 33374]|nr:hypothetical protein JCM33374_g1491 [Metschnikowia sp. JCM 33374]
MGRKLKGRQIHAKGLKGALQVHMVREKLKQEEQNSIQEKKQTQTNKEKSIKSGGVKKKKFNIPAQQKAFVPFKPSETLLLVGEGDFSFARSLVEQGLVLPEDLIATGFDSEAEMQTKYPNATENIEYLKESGVSVLHEIDATNLVHCFKVKASSKNQKANIFENGKRLNYIMFNFPHNGRGIKDMDRNIREHQKLVLGYFQSSKALFDVVNRRSNAVSSGYFPVEESTAQKVIMSLFEGEPYISWGVKALARSVGYRVERSGAFDWSYFSGYHHRRTNSMKDTTKPAEERDARIYLFDKALSKEEFEKLTGKKRKKDDDSDDE